jgi:hypothetical protein
MTDGHRSLGFPDDADELGRLREMFARSPSFSALFHGPDHRFALLNPAFQQLIGHRDVIGQSVREAMSEAANRGFIDRPRQSAGHWTTLHR